MLLPELLCRSINNIAEHSVITQLHYQLINQQPNNTDLIEMYKKYIDKIIEGGKHPLNNNISQVISCIYQNMQNKNEEDIKLILSITDDLFVNYPELSKDYILKFFRYLNDANLDNTIYSLIFNHMNNIKKNMTNEKLLYTYITLEMYINSNNSYFETFFNQYFNKKDDSHLNLLNQVTASKTNIQDALLYLVSINQIINNNLIINLNKDDLGYLLNICSDLKMDREHISYHHQYESFWSTKVRMNEDKLKEIKLNIYHHLHLISNLFNKEEWSKKLESCEMLGIPLSLDYIDQNLSMETIDFDLLN